MEHRFTELAYEDMRQALEWYGDDAADLFDDIDDAIDNIKANPGIGVPTQNPGVRKVVFTVFPYILPYRMKDGVLEILRVFNTNQEPPASWL